MLVKARHFRRPLSIAVLVAVSLSTIRVAGAAPLSNFVTLDHPLAAYGTYANGIDSGGTVVGSFMDSSGRQHAFIYDGTTLRTLQDLGPIATWAGDIWGGRVVG